MHIIVVTDSGLVTIIIIIITQSDTVRHTRTHTQPQGSLNTRGVSDNPLLLLLSFGNLERTDNTII